MEWAMDMKIHLISFDSLGSVQKESELSFGRGGGHQGIFDQGRGPVRSFVVVADSCQLLPSLLGLTLPVPHTGIKSAACQKLRVGASLGDAALVEHDYFVSRNNRRQPVSDHQRGPVARHPLQG